MLVPTMHGRRSSLSTLSEAHRQLQSQVGGATAAGPDATLTALVSRLESQLTARPDAAELQGQLEALEATAALLRQQVGLLINQHSGWGARREGKGVQRMAQGGRMVWHSSHSTA